MEKTSTCYSVMHDKVNRTYNTHIVACIQGECYVHEFEKLVGD